MVNTDEFHVREYLNVRTLDAPVSTKLSAAAKYKAAGTAFHSIPSKLDFARQVA